MKITNTFFLSSQEFRDIEPVERRSFLNLCNAINDLDFDNFLARGGTEKYIFESNVMGYSLSFEGFNLKLIFNITDERYYFSYESEKYAYRIIDVFQLKTWNDIDQWIEGKQFHYNEAKNVTPIEIDSLYQKYSKDKEE